MITPRDFVDRWAQSHLREQQAAQSHFNELCQLVGHKTLTQLDPEGVFFTFEEQVAKATGGRGRADVWYKGHFAWEYKGKHKDLDAAYSQLLAYKGDLDNPPLLVVCDFLEYRIYPQWPNSSGLPFVFKNEDLLRPEYQRFIQWLLESPDKFLELRQSELEQREQLTLQLAEKFAHLADLMRQHTNADGTSWEPLRVARFLTKLVFALFAEDINLLPRPYGQAPFRYIANGAKDLPEAFAEEMGRLFEAMDGVRSAIWMHPVPYFNGGIFRESHEGVGDAYEVLDLPQIPGGIDLLGEVSEADWRFVNPTIFGTLFEGALDISKRAQLGAHYTGEADIRLVVEPVLMQPLYREWEVVRAEAEPLLQTYLSSDAPKAKQDAHDRLLALYDRMMKRLENTRVLDPACGSGNFLYMSLRALKDLEARVRRTFEPLGLPFRDVVTPRQLYGIEKDEFAANLAKVVVWIGYLQWRYEDEGGILHAYNSRKQAHPRQLPHPILKDKNSPDEPDRIVCDDAIMRYDVEGKAYEPDWPEVDVIMGNPPFLGGKRVRAEIGDRYIDQLFALYEERVPHEADLVCYWYEKARTQIEHENAKRAGLLATNSIRGGSNRVVLDRIKHTGDIFYAWGDRKWILSGANVRISIIGFDDGTQKDYLLDGAPVNHINSDLQNTIDATKALSLEENGDIAFMGDTKGGSFDIPEDIAKTMLEAINPTGRKNSDVIRPWVNGSDITGRSRKMWIIDFGFNMTIEEAKLYELPFKYVQKQVYPERKNNRRDTYRERWWIHAEARPGMWQAITHLPKYIATVALAKHRLFVWLEGNVLPDHALFIFARSDDYFFGVLHSYLHEIWALRLGTSLEDRPRYTSTTTFETFPFPWPPGKEDSSSPHHAAISAAAKQLHEEREAWLNPPQEDYIALGITEKTLKERTLTNLYNALVAYREQPHPPTPSPFTERGSKAKNGNGDGNGNGKQSRIPKAAREFAPRLAELHDALDRAVLAAYGWGDLMAEPPADGNNPVPTAAKGSLRTAEGDEELLRRLLALNVQRAGA